MKFPFTKENKSNVWSCFGGIDKDLLTRFFDGLKAGKRMEMIIREEIDWDAVQMTKYFEGPVGNHFQERYADEGVAFGKGEVREGLLGKFLGWTEPNQFGQRHALSRRELDSPKDGKSPRQRWIGILKDIDAYSITRFGCGLPTQDNTDIGD